MYPLPWERGQARRWTVVADNGLLRLDEGGHDPLAVADDVLRLRNLCLAAAAPEMRHALGYAVNRLEYLAGMTGVPEVDRRIIQRGHGALISSRPTLAEVEALLAPENRQTDLFA